MAKKAIVTRSITSTNARILCINLTNQGVEENEFVLLGKFKTHEKLIEKVQLLLPRGVKAVSVIDVIETKKLYGMYEHEFLNQGFELDEKRNPVRENVQTLETENK